MASQSIGANSLSALNPDCMRAVINFCSVKDRYSLGTCSKELRLAMPKLTKQAKEFVEFESKLPLIKKIIELTSLYEVSEFGPRRLDSWPSYADRRVWANARWKYCVTTIICYFLLFKLLGENATGESARLYQTSTIVEDYQLTVLALIIGSYVLPRLLERYHHKNIDYSVPLMNLWYDLNGHIPENLLASGTRLESKLLSHERRSARYASEGGLDRYFARLGYRAGGLNQALHEVRSANPRTGAIIAL